MPIFKKRVRAFRQRSDRIAVQRGPRRNAPATRKLDTSVRLIGAAHSLTIPTLAGIKEKFEFSVGCDSALPLASALIKKGLLLEGHLRNATSSVGALEEALAEIVNRNFSGARDEFDMTACITDRLDDYRKPDGVLFFVWSNSMDPQYIPLRPVFEKLEGNPHRERLIASLYQWLYGAASRVFAPFGFAEAKNVYAWRKECYTDARENGEDVDFEGEIEAADPAKVMGYIRDSQRLILKAGEVDAAVESITDSKLRAAFVNANRVFLESRRIKLPSMSEDARRILDDAAYYMDAYPVPGLGISHWRDDPIVAWFDEFCQEQFESGSTARAPIILCFRPKDSEFFLQIVNSLPPLVRTIAGLSEWVRFAAELENACNYGDR
jgi:hypothetical protein